VQSRLRVGLAESGLKGLDDPGTGSLSRRRGVSREALAAGGPGAEPASEPGLVSSTVTVPRAVTQASSLGLVELDSDRAPSQASILELESVRPRQTGSLP
jgi:hypothetical protein